MGNSSNSENLIGKSVLVYGMGKSGTDAASLLLRCGASVLCYDSNTSLDKDKLGEKLGKGQNYRIITGEFPEGELFGIDIAVLSPGVPTDIPEVGRIREHNIPVWGEIELAYRVGKGEVLAITGTNGKTTTTSLLGEIMKTAGKHTFICGNIGLPYTEIALDTTDNSVSVLEISSFQLETADTFRPHVSAILNITPDHLNRHHTMERYIDTKLSITKNQGPDDFCILNAEDEILESRADSIGCKKVFFSSKRELEGGVFLRDGAIISTIGGAEEKIIETSELNIIGTHNHENAMAAAAMAICAGVPVDIIRDAMRAFLPVEHRIEFTAEVGGVRYYNDSKGTNPDAAIKGIQAMDRPTVLIGGGYDKQSDYKEWIKSFDGKVKKLVLIGETREKIAADATEVGFTDYVFAGSLEEAMDICKKEARAGDAVLLSPACASWDMFPNYEVRGRRFKEIVREMEK